MATFDDNIKTIGTAVYGKEMRPAISEALTQSWEAVKIMTGAVNQLNARIDNLPSGGGGGTVDPDRPDYPSASTGGLADMASMVMDVFITTTQTVGQVTLI